MRKTTKKMLYNVGMAGFSLYFFTITLLAIIYLVLASLETPLKLFGQQINPVLMIQLLTAALLWFWVMIVLQRFKTLDQLDSKSPCYECTLLEFCKYSPDSEQCMKNITS